MTKVNVVEQIWRARNRRGTARSIEVDLHRLTACVDGNDAVTSCNGVRAVKHRERKAGPRVKYAGEAPTS